MLTFVLALYTALPEMIFRHLDLTRTLLKLQLIVLPRHFILKIFIKRKVKRLYNEPSYTRFLVSTNYTAPFSNESCISQR